MFFSTECLPIAITSLIPIVLFPLFGIMPSKTVTRGYFQVKKNFSLNWNFHTFFLISKKDIILLFYGGLVMANAIEISGLHERISLKVLLLFGSNPKWYRWFKSLLKEIYTNFNCKRLMLGFMSITAFMSLWISNAASCSMMLPMVYKIFKIRQSLIIKLNFSSIA